MSENNKTFELKFAIRLIDIDYFKTILLYL